MKNFDFESVSYICLTLPYPFTVICRTPKMQPMLLFVYASFKVGAWDTPVWILFTLAYAYFGYVA